MPNTIITPKQVVREALRVLHGKLPFIGNVNRQYDDKFKIAGAKAGDEITVKLPAQYTIRRGATLSAQDTVQSSVSLKSKEQYGVDVNFTSKELTMDLDDFSANVIEPAVSVIAANLEADFYTDAYKSVYNIVDGDGVAFEFSHALAARQALVDNLTPPDNNISCVLTTAHNAKIVNALKGVFNPQEDIGKLYRDGVMGKAASMRFYESTHASNHTTGTAAKTTGYVMNTSTGLTSGTATLTISGGTTTFLIGDVITIADVYRVHPETKVNTGVLQHFVVTANSGTSATGLTVSPAPVTSGSRQNVALVSAGASKALVKVGAGASETLNSSMAFHKDAFIFATTDLIMPSGVDFAAREVMDGISMRVVRQYDINNDKFPCRIDVLPAWTTARAQMACRIHADA